MKEVIKFVCEKCKAEYDCQSSAEDCESGHRPVDRISDATYASEAFGSYPYPEYLTIKASDGAEIWYRFAKKI